MQISSLSGADKSGNIMDLFPRRIGDREAMDNVRFCYLNKLFVRVAYLSSFMRSFSCLTEESDRSVQTCF